MMGRLSLYTCLIIKAQQENLNAKKAESVVWIPPFAFIRIFGVFRVCRGFLKKILKEMKKSDSIL